MVRTLALASSTPATNPRHRPARFWEQPNCHRRARFPMLAFALEAWGAWVDQGEGSMQGGGTGNGLPEWLHRRGQFVEVPHKQGNLPDLLIAERMPEARHPGETNPVLHFPIGLALGIIPDPVLGQLRRPNVQPGGDGR